jgi:UDP-2,4-diacetamido-2,4,6-trideoxy-beta-L-altropyranose hydrolase
VEVAFRVDSSIVMGMGHVMRCLTLADALKEDGANIQFIVREHKGSLANEIRDRGYQVKLLPTPRGNTQSEKSDSGYAQWLGVSLEQDADETRQALGSLVPDWLIVDHYALDTAWESQLRKTVKNIMVIDDLTNRKHDCDVLLDQTFNRDEKDYRKLVPESCRILTGSGYALLRSEFRKSRDKAIERRASRKGLHSIMVSLGGTDPDNVTETILLGLSQSNLDTDSVVTVLLGKHSPHLDSVKNYAQHMRMNTTLLVDAKNVAEVMLNSDLAIGAGGTSAWERCCVGLPSLISVNAENQQKIVSELAAKGAVENMGWYRELTADKVAGLINELIKNPDKLAKMSSAALTVTDGEGAAKVVNVLYG